MADTKISALTELAVTPATGDLLAIVDVSDSTHAASGTTKKITRANFLGGTVTVTEAVTVDPATHPNGCRLHVDAPTGNQLDVTLPVVASAPAIGYTIRASSVYPGGMEDAPTPIVVKRASGAAINSGYNWQGEVTITYLGRNIWQVYGQNAAVGGSLKIETAINADS